MGESIPSSRRRFLKTSVATAAGIVLPGWAKVAETRRVGRLTPERMRLDLRFVTSVENPNGTGSTERSWVVEDGVAGAVPA